ncbi:hypothetical protein ACJJTC_017598 [Scirpophaga incertulas]
MEYKGGLNASGAGFSSAFTKCQHLLKRFRGDYCLIYFIPISSIVLRSGKGYVFSVAGVDGGSDLACHGEPPLAPRQALRPMSMPRTKFHAFCFYSELAACV